MVFFQQYGDTHQKKQFRLLKAISLGYGSI